MVIRVPARRGGVDAWLVGGVALP